MTTKDIILEHLETLCGKTVKFTNKELGETTVMVNYVLPDKFNEDNVCICTDDSVLIFDHVDIDYTVVDEDKEPRIEAVQIKNKSTDIIDFKFDEIDDNMKTILAIPSMVALINYIDSKNLSGLTVLDIIKTHVEGEKELKLITDGDMRLLNFIKDKEIDPENVIQMLLKKM